MDGRKARQAAPGGQNLNASRVPSEVRLELGGLVLAFVPTSSDLEVAVSDRYRPFVSDAPPETTLTWRASLDGS